MLRTFICLLLWLSTHTYAQSDEEQIIREIARRQNLSIEEVKQDWEEGCASGVTPNMVRCTYFHFLAQDIELNKTYAELRNKLSTKLAKERLQKAQRTWLTYRDATCEYEAVGWTGGTGWGVIYNGCLNATTKERNIKLKEYLDCDGGGCPE